PRDRCVRRAAGWNENQRASGAAAGPDGAKNAIRHGCYGKTADVLAGTRAGILRCSRGSRDRSRGGGGWISLVVDDAGDREEHAVSDENRREVIRRDMFIAKKHISRRTLLRGAGT